MKNLNFKMLIANTKGDVSLGRVSYWLVLVILMIFWGIQYDIPSSLEIVFLTLCSYNLGTKVNNTIQVHLETKGRKTKAGSEDPEDII